MKVRVGIRKLDYILRSRGCSRSPVNRDRKFSHFPASSTRWIVPALIEFNYLIPVPLPREDVCCLVDLTADFLHELGKSIGSANAVEQSINLFARFFFLQNSFVTYLTAEEIRSFSIL